MKKTSVFNFVLVIVIAVLAAVSGFVVGSTKNQSQKDSAVATNTVTTPGVSSKQFVFQSGVSSDGFVVTRSFEYNSKEWTNWTKSAVGKSEVTFLNIHNNFNTDLRKTVQAVQGQNGYIYTRTTTNGSSWSRWMMDDTIRIRSKVSMIQCENNPMMSVIGRDGAVHTRTGYEENKRGKWSASIAAVGNIDFSRYVDIATNKTYIFQTVRNPINRIFTRSSADCGQTWTNWFADGITPSDVTTAQMAFAGDISGFYQFSRSNGNQIMYRKLEDSTINKWSKWGRVNGTTTSRISLTGSGITGGGIAQTYLSTDNKFFTGANVGISEGQAWEESGIAKLPPTIYRDGLQHSLFQTYIGMDDYAYTRFYIVNNWSEWEKESTTKVSTPVNFITNTFIF